MATHDYVVRRIKTWHEQQGDDVTAELRGYQKPPKFTGPGGRAYIQDVYVYNLKMAYEVKEYWAHRTAVAKLKAFAASPSVEALALVLCTGTPDGIPRAGRFLTSRGVDCEVLNYRELPFW